MLHYGQRELKYIGHQHFEQRFSSFGGVIERLNPQREGLAEIPAFSFFVIISIYLTYIINRFIMGNW